MLLNDVPVQLCLSLRPAHLLLKALSRLLGCGVISSRAMKVYRAHVPHALGLALVKSHCHPQSIFGKEMNGTVGYSEDSPGHFQVIGIFWACSFVTF